MSRSRKWQGMFAHAFSRFGNFFRIFRIHIFFSYGEFSDITIKLRVEVTAIAAADNLGQRGQSIILR